MSTGEVIFGVFFMLILAGMIISIVNIRSNRSSETGTKFEEALERIEAKLDHRLEKLESRMANLETIVLEDEKHKEFHRTL